LYGRFKVSGEEADLHHAVDFAGQAAEARPDDWGALADLAGLEEVRYRRSGDMGDLLRMAEHQRAAVAAGRNAPRRDQYELQVRLAVRVTLEAGVLKQWSMLDEPAAQRKMTEAVEGAQASLRLAEPDSRERFDGLAALLDAIRLRYLAFGSLADLDTAIAALDELSGWTGSPRALKARIELAQTLQERSKRTNSREDLQRAIQTLSQWLASTPFGAPGRAAAEAELERWQAQLAGTGDER
jgi:hypothetical protein